MTSNLNALARPIEIAISVTRMNESSRNDFTLAVDAEHLAIRDAIADGDAPGARKAAARHMQQSASRVLSADKEFWVRGRARITNLPPAP